MTSNPNTPGIDPAPVSDDMMLADEAAEPIVARDTRAMNPVAIAAIFAIFAIILFVWLNARRAERAEAGLLQSAATAQQAASAVPPPLELPLTPISNAGAGAISAIPVQVGMPPQITPPPPTIQAAPFSGAGSATASDMMQRRRAPAVVVDLGGAPRDVVLAQAGASPGAGAGATSAVAGQPGTQRSQLTDSEQFAQRVGDEAPDRARAVAMRNPRAVAPQGTIIPGVLETAINSDLPGFTRAVVSRDVLSFDGKAVLIPRGSRLIGQYKSAVALGQTRAFIIWTRVIRPDGVSIQIGSPGTDQLGRGGLDGTVDRHFFRRFSGSILLSVLSAATASLGQTPATQITIGSPTAAAGAAGSALLGEAIPPTIKVPQGEAINIFVSRDLDFSSVGAAG